MAITAPDVQEQSLPNFRVSEAANDTTFGGGRGPQEVDHEVQKIASDTASIAIVEKTRQDQTAIEEAQANASKLTTDVLYNPQTGVLTSRGTNALQAHKDGMKTLQKGMNEISQNLHGDEQIGSFNRWAHAHAAATNTTMMGHVDKELADHDAKSYESLLANQQGLVAMAHGNPEVLALGFQTVNENAKAFAERNRLDPEQTTQFIQDANDKMHASVIDGMLKFQNDDSADTYFQANKDSMSPAMQEKVAVALNEGNIRHRSARASVEIWKKADGNLSNAFKEADKIDNPEVQEMTKQKLRQLQSDKVAVQEADQNDKFQQAWGLVKNAPPNKPIALRETVPPMLWSQLLPSNQEILKKLAFNNETNAQKWTEFSLMTPTQLKGITSQDLQMTYLPEFKPADREKAVKLWNQAQSNSVDSYLNTQQSHMIADAARMTNVAGLTPGDPRKPSHDPTKLKGDRAKEYHAWADVAQQAILNYETTKLGGKRKATQEETQQVIDSLVISKMGQKSFLGILPYGGKTVVTTPYEDIPAEDKQKILSFAGKRGVKATPEQVQRAYFFLQQKDKESAIKALSE